MPEMLLTTLLIYSDRSGFIPGKGTDINFRRLFTIQASSVSSQSSPRVNALLDLEKVFDSVEWIYLWTVLRRFGSQCISWLQYLYASPTATIRTRDVLSPAFNLLSRTRHGCPLSLVTVLFSFTIEPLAILLMPFIRVGGVVVGTLEEEISL